MPSDQYSTLLNLLLMADGGDANIWGDNTNTNLNLIEQAIAQQTSVDISQFTGNSYTLTVYNGAQDDARAIGIEITGTMADNSTVIFPNIPRLYVINNQLTNNVSPTGGYTLTCETSGGTATYNTLAGQQAIYCDGDGNIYGVSLPTLLTACLAQYQSFAAGTAWTPVAVTVPSDGGTATVNVDLSNNFYLQIPNGAEDFTVEISVSGLLPPPSSDTALLGQTINIVILQNTSGNVNVSWLPSSIIWAGGETPTLSTSPGAADFFTLTYIDDYWYGNVIADYSPSGGSTAHTITISQNAQNWTLQGQLSGLSGSPVINIIVPEGVCVWSADPELAALNLYDTSLPAGTTLNLTVNGLVIGAGGRGGDAPFSYGSGSDGALIGLQRVDNNATGDSDSDVSSPNGQHGGTAIIGPGSSVSHFNLLGNGLIYGGGGGGGAGGIATDLSAQALAGGGGAGCGGAKGGKGWIMYYNSSSAKIASTAGGDTPPGPSQLFTGGNLYNVGGSGGSGASNGTASGADGGAGGALVTAGSAGSDYASGTYGFWTQDPGQGGVAGWGINNDATSFSISDWNGNDNLNTYSTGDQNYPYW